MYLYLCICICLFVFVYLYFCICICICVFEFVFFCVFFCVFLFVYLNCVFLPIFHPLCGILLTTRGTRWCCLQQFRPLLFSIRLIKKIDLVVAYIVVCLVSRPWTKDQALLCIIVFSIPLYHRINTISNGTIGLELGIV